MIEKQILFDGWEFRRLGEKGAKAEPWIAVEVPHSPFVADLNGQDCWFGLCEYRRKFKGNACGANRHELYVGAAMHTTTVFVDGKKVASHLGGYLPFTVDLSRWMRGRGTHELVLQLDNRDALDVPPGKPHAELDFCWYGGLYREVEWRVYPPLHITEVLSEERRGGGGVFVRTLKASPSSALVAVDVHVRNSSRRKASACLSVELWHEGALVSSMHSPVKVLQASRAGVFSVQLEIPSPKLWSIAAPNLHQVRVQILDTEGRVLDTDAVRAGLRTVSFTRSGGFCINGESQRPHGANRHQDHPRVGYALSRAAQHRDARRLKESGFDYVRLSHYPQDRHFLEACDELGIVVMNCIPGWQYLGGRRFRERCVRHARELVRRDRNHPCVVLWELSLNETDMDEAFIKAMQGAGHEEHPDGSFHTCGWMEGFDVFIHSRQHGQLHSWQRGDQALVVAEYGDWEFYAANHGFDQKTGAGLHAEWSNSRQFRADGERGLRQQLANHALALNDILSSPAVLDGVWSLCDYPRGYHPLRAGCGVLDFFRLPKFSHYFYRSQRHVEHGGPVLHIASHWVPSSALRLPVLTNLDEVELRLNGRVIARKTPERTWMSQNLPHPPVLFDLPAFEPGVLEAVGWHNGVEVSRHEVRTPEDLAGLELWVDHQGVSAKAGEPDVLLVHASLKDANGSLCIEQAGRIRFKTTGAAEIIGPSEVAAEAGLASVVVRVSAACRKFTLEAATMPGDGVARRLKATLGWQRQTQAGGPLPG